MALGAGVVRATRSVMICMNSVFLLCGLGLLAMGVVVVTHTATIVIANKQLAYYSIGLGAFVTLVACCGCFGAVMRSKFLLQFYFVLLLIVFAAQVSIVLIAFTQHAKLESLIETTWDDSGSSVRVKFQNEHNCCGFEVPEAPCAQCANITACAVPGCKATLDRLLKKNLLIIEIVACAVALFELVGLVGACCVICGKRKGGDDDDDLWSINEPLLGDKNRGRTDTSASSFSTRSTQFAARPRNPSYNRLPATSNVSVGTAANSIYMAGAAAPQDGDVASSVSSTGSWRPRTTAEMIAEIRRDRLAKERGDSTSDVARSPARPGGSIQ
eukprot:Amastigsp_a509073_333.p2 type:complete len:328 gc:universal Amastigsp_a509073_333:41-1024(+)